MKDDMQWRAAHAAELAANRQIVRNLLDNTTGMTNQIFRESTRDTQFHESKSDSLSHLTLKTNRDSIIGHQYLDGSMKAVDGHSILWLKK